MKLAELKEVLSGLERLAFELPNGELVPSHFHVTEVGQINKHFIDCGGTVRRENVISLQLWNANDYDHRLHPEKLMQIIALSEKTLALENLDIEVEFQGETIQKFGLAFNGQHFLLTSTHTACLAQENCGIPTEKPQVEELQASTTSCCDPSSGCC